MHSPRRYSRSDPRTRRPDRRPAQRRGRRRKSRRARQESGRALLPPEAGRDRLRSEEHTSELQSLMRISYAVFCLKKKKDIDNDKAHFLSPDTKMNIFLLVPSKNTQPHRIPTKSHNNSSIYMKKETE